MSNYKNFIDLDLCMKRQCKNCYKNKECFKKEAENEYKENKNKSIKRGKL